MNRLLTVIRVPYKDRDKQQEAQHRSYLRHKDEIRQRQIENRPATNERNRRSRKENAAVIRKLKEDTPCFDCGLRFRYYVTDYDHVRGDKVAAVARLLNANCSLDAILAEIAKCELVCSNCHRERTHGKR